jgi:hypothetical protein
MAAASECSRLRATLTVGYYVSEELTVSYQFLIEELQLWGVG